MKTGIAVLACLGVVTIGAFRPPLRAEDTPPSEQAPAAAGSSTSVWDGIYTDEQATRGERLYAQKCAACHASDLSGGETAPSLNNAEFKANWSGLSVNDLFERVRISMPQDSPGSMSRQQIADTLAFVLSRGGFPSGQTELPREGEALKLIRFEANKP